MAGARGEVVEKVLWLWFASRRPDPPAWHARAYLRRNWRTSCCRSAQTSRQAGWPRDDLGVLRRQLFTVASCYVDADVRRRNRGRALQVASPALRRLSNPAVAQVAGLAQRAAWATSAGSAADPSLRRAPAGPERRTRSSSSDEAGCVGLELPG